MGFFDGDSQALLSRHAIWALSVLGISFCFCIYRLMRGPSSVDRILAIDLASTIGIAFIAVFALYARQEFYLDLALCFAVISFFATVLLARFFETDGARRD